jgi:AcrR family transcriptional regulator
MVEQHEGRGDREPGHEAEPTPVVAAPKDPRNAIIEALLELAGERAWEDITLSDVAIRANLSLSTFRDLFPSKGAVLASFTRMIDKTVLDGTTDELVGEPAKDRLFDVVMRRLDALEPYKLGVEGIFDWARRDPLAAAAINRLVVNSMRFMLEAAGIESEGPVGAIKLQGLALAWGRILDAWLHDDDPGHAETMAALDRELSRGEHFVARAEDLNRLASPIVSLARALLMPRRSTTGGARSHRAERSDEPRPS